jgi:type II secretory pathway pseudopilin PulG
MKQNKQQGFTFIGLVIVLGFVGMVVLSVLKVFPIYMEHLSVQKSLESLEADPAIRSMSTKAIKDKLEKKFNVNQVTSIDRKTIKVQRGTGDLKVEITYEVREDYIGNVDIVLSFSDNFIINL